MAGFKQRSLTLHQLQSIPNDIDQNTIDIFYLNDGSIRAQAGDGTVYRLDNVDSTLVSVSGQLYSLIQTVSGDLVVYVNSVSGSLYNQFTAADQLLYSSIQTVSGSLNSQIISVDSNAVHKTGNESINGIKTFGDVAYFMNGMVVNGEIIAVEVTNLKVGDNIISLNAGVTGTPFLNGGIEIVRGVYPSSQIIWNEGLGYWTAGTSGGLEKIILQSDLNAALLSISGGAVSTMQAQIAEISGNVTTIFNELDVINSNVSDISANVNSISNNVSVLNGQVASISANYTPLVTTSNISGNLQSQINYIGSNYTLNSTTSAISAYLQSQINDISAASLSSYYTKTQTNAITASLYADYTNSDSNILSYVTTVSSQQKLYIDGNFVNRSSNQTVSGDKSFVNTNGNIVLSTQNTALNDSFGIAASNWNSRFLYDNLGVESVDWKDRELYDALLNVTVDWELKNLYSTWSVDALNVLSLPISGAGNFLTWNASKKLVDSGINANTLTAQTANTSAYLQTEIVQLSGYSQAQLNSINTLFSTYANSTTVAAISAGLDSRITANTTLDTQQGNSINTLFSTYANSTTVAAISAGLQSQATTASTVNTQQTNSINTLFSTYANSTTIAAISAGLNTQVQQISGYTQSNTNGINTLFSTYANSTTVAAISAGLDSRITANTLLDTQQGNSINTLFSTYANSTTVAAISAGLDSRITANTTLDTQQGNSINTLFSTYANSTTVAAISAGLDSRITANTTLDTQQGNSINTLFSTYANSTTVAAISAGLVSTGTQQANSINTLFSTYANSTTVADISAGLFATDTYLQSQINSLAGISGAYALDSGVVHNYGNEVVGGVKTFTSTISGNIDNTILNVGVNNAQNIQIGGNNTSLINIGQGNITTTINIGSAGDTVNVLGDLVYVKTTNSQVLNKSITINASGAVGSSNLGGIYVQEGAISGAGYARIDNARSSWSFKAPANAGVITLTPSINGVTDQIVSSSTGNQVINLQDKSGTIALLGDIPTSTSVVHTTGNETVSGIKTFLYPSTNLSLSTSGSAFYDTPTNKSIDWASGILYANIIGSKSVDYANRNLYGSTGFVTLDYANKKLFDSNGYTSYDWGQRLAWYNNNSTIAINFSGTEVAINDISGNKAFSSNRTLLDAATVVALDWNNKQLYGLWTANDGMIVGSVVPVTYNSTKTTGIISPNSVIDTIATSANEGASWKIIVTDGVSNKRISTVDSVFTSAIIEYTEYSTMSLGDTSAVSLSCDISGGNARLLASASSGTWTVKASRINFLRGKTNDNNK